MHMLAKRTRAHSARSMCDVGFACTHTCVCTYCPRHTWNAQNVRSRVSRTYACTCAFGRASCRARKRSMHNMIIAASGLPLSLSLSLSPLLLPSHCCSHRHSIIITVIITIIITTIITFIITIISITITGIDFVYFSGIADIVAIMVTVIITGIAFLYFSGIVKC